MVMDNRSVEHTGRSCRDTARLGGAIYTVNITQLLHVLQVVEPEKKLSSELLQDETSRCHLLVLGCR